MSMPAPPGAPADGTDDDLQRLSQDRDGLAADIARGREDLAEAARELGGGTAGDGQLQALARRYGPLLLPVALLVLMNPRRSVRLAATAWQLYRSAQSGVSTGQQLHDLADSFTRRIG